MIFWYHLHSLTLAYRISSYWLFGWAKIWLVLTRSRVHVPILSHRLGQDALLQPIFSKVLNSPLIKARPWCRVLTAADDLWLSHSIPYFHTALFGQWSFILTWSGTEFLSTLAPGHHCIFGSLLPEALPYIILTWWGHPLVVEFLDSFVWLGDFYGFHLFSDDIIIGVVMTGAWVPVLGLSHKSRLYRILRSLSPCEGLMRVVTRSDQRTLRFLMKTLGTHCIFWTFFLNRWHFRVIGSWTNGGFDSCMQTSLGGCDCIGGSIHSKVFEREIITAWAWHGRISTDACLRLRRADERTLGWLMDNGEVRVIGAWSWVSIINRLVKFRVDRDFNGIFPECVQISVLPWSDATSTLDSEPVPALVGHYKSRRRPLLSDLNLRLVHARSEQRFITRAQIAHVPTSTTEGLHVHIGSQLSMVPSFAFDCLFGREVCV